MKGKTVRMTAGFSSETTEAEGSGTTFFKCRNKKNSQLRILYPAKISFRKKGKSRYSQMNEK